MLKIVMKIKKKTINIVQYLNKPFSFFSGHELQNWIYLHLSFDLVQSEIQQLSLSEILNLVITAMCKI